VGQELCQQCKALDLPRLLRQEGSVSARGTLILHKHGLSEAEIKGWENSPCAVCRLVFSMVQTTLGVKTRQTNTGFTLAIRAFENPTRYKSLDEKLVLIRATVEFGEPDYRWWSGGFFGICATDSEYLTNSIASIRPVEHDRVDFGVLKRWFACCRLNHDSSFCNMKEELSVTNLRVIDCRSRSLIHTPPHCEYVALSYVWGDHTAAVMDLSIGDVLPSTVPRTIEDAITATLRLGFRFLWIDRYCIQQGNKDDFHTQVKQMDRIYKGAQVTLFATYGDDPNAGLPGVSTTSRIPQQKTKIDGLQVASIPLNPRWKIESCTWNSRAWTFQEAVFSRRRLFFNEDQVVYECSEMQCLETTHASMIVDPSKLPLCLYPSCGIGKNPWDIILLIEKYSWRKLSYEKDVLNGFLGIFRAFQDIQPSVWNFWGVPILPSVAKGESGEKIPLKRNSCDGFVLGLCWSWIEQPVMHECRQSAFPSWSWTGWKWPQNFFHARYDGQGNWGSSTDIDIRIELCDGQVMTWAAFEQAQFLRNDLSSVTRFLHIEAWTVTVTLGCVKENNPHGVDDDDDDMWMLLAIPQQENNAYPKWRFPMTLHGRSRPHEKLNNQQGWEDGGLRGRHLTGIILGDAFASPSKTDNYPFVMLVEEKEEFAERVGSTSFGSPYTNNSTTQLSEPSTELTWNFDSFKLQKRIIRVG
jgi:hypothetical protein